MDAPKDTEVPPEASSSNNEQAVAKTDKTEMSAQSLIPLLEQISRLQAVMEKQQKNDKNDKKENHKFWSTQPVPDFDEETAEMGPVEPDKKPDEIRQSPYNLPAGYEWSDVDITNEEQLKELYELLTMNYVEDEDAMFRFDYSADFLRWALHPPGWKAMWLPGVRVSATKKLVGFISAIPVDLQVYSHRQIMVEINFLCVHKKLRSKRLAPVLIKEITRRVHLNNIFQATYTAGIRIPRPVASCRYYHRSLNPKKLIETGFSHLGRNMTMARTIKLYKLPDEPQIPTLREMQESDIKTVHHLFTEFVKQFSMYPIMTEEEVRHWMLPRPNIVFTYVVEDSASKKVTDFVSFYCLPSSVIKHSVHKEIKAAYSFYYATTKTPLLALMKDALIMARKHDFDVFNCLNLMKNEEFLDELKFGIGDGQLQYYLYNWKCPTMSHDKMGLVLL